jgi:hypothetical protein
MLSRARYAFGICAAAVMSSCGSSGSPLLFAPPATGWSSPAQGSVATSNGNLTARSDQSGSWMAPDAKEQDLLYVSNATTVTVYSYPQGKLEGTLKGFYRTEGECVDKKGDVFITNLGTGQIFEYAHGSARRFATLKSPAAEPIGCSVDATTRDLAVSTLGGTVEIYKKARRNPTKYTDPQIPRFFYCGYDDKGNLFVDGQNGSELFKLAELPKGSDAFKAVTLNQSIGWPGGVQWDGGHVAVGDQDAPVIYEFIVREGQGAEVGSTPLGSHAFDVAQFFIQGQTVVAPNVYFTGKGGTLKAHSDALLFHYPAGGAATKAIKNEVRFPNGAVVSEAMK